jgi:hypothetical protein
MRTGQLDRRRERRRPPGGPIGVRQMSPVLPLSDAEVLDISKSGVALRTRVPLRVADRLSFTTGPQRPPVLAEVLAVEPLDGEWFRVRCRCLLGDFAV